MLSLTTCLLLFLIYRLLTTIVSLLRNIRIANSTGLKYVIVPYYAYNRLTSLFFGRAILPLTNKFLGPPPILSWRRLVSPSFPLSLKHSPFALLGTDTFLTVSPGGIILQTADADVNAQIIARGGDFPKAIHLYGGVDVYGKNILSSEGEMWRHHRRLVVPAFGERNNELVWRETLEQTRGLVAVWLGRDGKGRGGEKKTILTVGEDAKKLSLSVISCAGLGRKMGWSSAAADGGGGGEGIPEGHTMSFTSALQGLLQSVLVVLMLPPWFLRKAPFKRVQKAYRAYLEWGQYMKEMIAAKKSALDSSPTASDSSTVDFLGQLVRAQESDSEGEGEKAGGKTPRAAVTLSDSEVLGNLFVLTFAGHETSASSIHFSLIFLALHPSIQRDVQRELDAIFQGRPPSEWDYTRDLPRLLSGLLGAVLSEELRLIAPIVTVPKVVAGPTPQRLLIDGRETALPPGMMVRMCVPSVHRNPKFWPAKEEGDLEAFQPSRWLLAGENHSGADPSHLYKPPKGAYIPFSDGPRGCLGRRFAQIEILACLAVILSQCTIELGVDEFADDEEVAGMSAEERRDVWRKARDDGMQVLRERLLCVITVGLRRGERVGVRCVMRGRERFGDLDLE